MDDDEVFDLQRSGSCQIWSICDLVAKPTSNKKTQVTQAEYPFFDSNPLTVAIHTELLCKQSLIQSAVVHENKEINEEMTINRRS